MQQVKLIEAETQQELVDKLNEFLSGGGEEIISLANDGKSAMVLYEVPDTPGPVDIQLSEGTAEELKRFRNLPED